MPPRRPIALALAVGLLHGPAEVLPVSSSGHAALLLGDGEPGGPGRRVVATTGLEVALHAGTLAGLAVGLRRELVTGARRVRAAPREAASTAARALALAAPAGLAGRLLEGAVERRTGGPRQVAVAQVLAGGLLVLADGRPAGDDASHGDRREGARRRAAVAVALAQPLALVPGVSRGGATLTAARLAGADRRTAHRLGVAAGLPVTLGAIVHRASRGATRGRDGDGEPGPPVARRGPRTRQPPPDPVHLVALLGATVGGLAATPLARALAAGAPTWPFGLYRVALGLAVLARHRTPRGPR